MTITIIGPGAIGLLCAIRLAHAGQPVALLARPASAATLAAQPLRLRQDGRLLQTTSVTVLGDPHELARRGMTPSLAVVCVKGYDTANALSDIAALGASRILTLQNGIGNEETLVERFGAMQVLSGAITTSVEIEEPGAINVTKSGGIGIAPVGGPPAEAQHWAAQFAAAGFSTHVYNDYRAMKWSKALLNLLGNATAAILNMPVNAVYADRRLVALEQRAFLEALQVMRRQGSAPVNLPRYPAAWLARAMRYLPASVLYPLLRRLIAGGRGGKPPSLQLDLARGNTRTEGAFLYGAVAAVAEQVGLRAPVNQGLWHVLQAITSGEVAWQQFWQNPDALLEAVAHANQVERVRP